jgi:hypothetical protein
MQCPYLWIGLCHYLAVQHNVNSIHHSTKTELLVDLIVLLLLHHHLLLYLHIFLCLVLAIAVVKKEEEV